MFKRPFEVYLLCVLLLFLSIGALYGGGALILKPDGSFLQMQPWLNKIPFPDFLIPGIVLFVFNGLLPLLVVVGLLFKPNWMALNVLNIYSDKHWSWTFALYSGIITITWIIVQQFVTEYFVLQPIVAFTGLLIMVLTLMPRVIKHYSL
jgi:hypothetical protein